MDRLLLVNDLINQVVERLQRVYKGQFRSQGTYRSKHRSRKGGADAVPTAKITDLISFDDESTSQPASATAGGASGSSNIMDDFASLTFDNAPARKLQAQTAAPTSTGLGGLPADLFSSTPTTADRSTPRNGAATASTRYSLGNWAPSNSQHRYINIHFPPHPPISTLDRCSAASDLMNLPSLTPTNSSSAATAAAGGARLNGQPSQQQQQQQKAKSNDPFADLDAMFK